MLSGSVLISVRVCNHSNSVELLIRFAKYKHRTAVYNNSRPIAVIFVPTSRSELSKYSTVLAIILLQGKSNPITGYGITEELCE